MVSKYDAVAGAADAFAGSQFAVKSSVMEESNEF
jgi:hypothetical protein